MGSQLIAPEAAGLDPLLVKAISHPIRLDALQVFSEKGVASPNEVANEIGETVGKVSHHVTVLKDCGCLELVDTAQRRGATEHYYRATARANVTDAISEHLPRLVREALGAKALTAIVERLAQAVEAGTVDKRTDRHISWMPLTLDEKGWADLIALKAKTLEDEMQIEAEAAARLAKNGAEGVPVFTSALCFEAPAG